MKKRLTAWVIATVFVFLSWVTVFKDNTCGAGEAGQANACAVRILKNRDYFPSLVQEIEKAKQEIIICAYLFRTSGYPGNYPEIVIEHLLQAAKRGVRVEVILERSKDPADSLNQDNEATGKRLEKGGVKATFDSPQRTTHAKLAVVDRRYTFVGSHNMTHSALKYNNEVSVLIDSPAVADEMLRYIRTGIAR